LTSTGGGSKSKKTKKDVDASEGAVHENKSGSDSDQPDEAAAAHAAPRAPPSAAAKEKIAKLKSRRSQLSAAQFEEVKALAANIAQCSTKEQADWLWMSYQRSTPASELEREAAGLTSSGLVKLPNGASVSALEEGLKTLEPTWRQELCSAASRSAGELTVLIISPAALGCTSVIQSCPDFNKQCRIAKLFAKHFKVHEQVEALKLQPAAIGAGTPNRLAKLLEVEALKLEKIRYIVLDVRLDVKKRTILDMPEVTGDWWALWDNCGLKKRVAEGKAKLILFGDDA
jgi:protein CMS1